MPVTSTPIRIGTRGSALALVQARQVSDALTAADVPNKLVIVETAGDRRAPDTAWGEGAFVAAIEEALIDGRVDVAVHSAKDVPTDHDPRLTIAAFLPRADPRDALVAGLGASAATLATLPSGSRIGTDSPRRTGFVLAARPDLQVVPFHGNVDTRLRRLDDGEVDALVLAVAGLERLGRGDRVSEPLAPDLCPPAPGQGSIAIQVRTDDADVALLIAAVDDPPTRAAVELERAFLAAMGGGCRSPIGALARLEGGSIELLAGVAAVDGSWARVERVAGDQADVPARIEELVARLGPVRADTAGRRRVLITRPTDSAAQLGEALGRLGIESVSVPAIATEPLPDGGALDEALADLEDGTRIVVTSPTGAATVLSAMDRLRLDATGMSWLAVGRATAAVLSNGEVTDVWVPGVTRSAGLVAEVPLDAGDRLLLARGDLADARLPDGLRARGATVREVIAYRTIEAPSDSTPLLRRALAGTPIDAVLFASGSAVRGLLTLAGDRAGEVRALPAICLGPETATEARRLGFRVVGEAPMQSAEAMAAFTASILVPGAVGVRA
ncbi:MAG: hydroxymethylbilane synthase [Candidatus Limnocylindrales bacterium]